MKLNNDNFSKTLSQHYDNFTKQEYYQMFPQSILHYAELHGGIAGKSVFDVGCGNGDLSALFSSQGASYVLGLDISDSQIEIAKKTQRANNLEFTVGDAYKVKRQEKAPFDVVVSMYAFHFIKNIQILHDAAKNLYDNLKEGGTLVFLDITHDYIYDAHKMEQLKALTSYSYKPHVEQGQIPELWSVVEGLVTLPTGTIKVDHIAIHGPVIKKALEAVGFNTVERQPFVFHDKSIIDFWGPEGFNHHLFVAKK